MAATNVLTPEEIVSSLQATANESIQMCQTVGIKQDEVIEQGRWMMEYCKKLYIENKPQFTLLANELLQACPGLVCFFSQFPNVQIAFHSGTRIPLLYF